MPEGLSSFDRRKLLAGTAAVGAVGLLGLSKTDAAEPTAKEHKMTAADAAIRPFHYNDRGRRCYPPVSL